MYDILLLYYKKGSNLMGRNINIIVANPAGNITIFVLDKIEKEDYALVGKKLLDIKDLQGEQVAFIKELSSRDKLPFVGEIEMCGMEFCGNASRSFALIAAKAMGLTGLNVVKVKTSGSKQLLKVIIEADKGYTKIQMPNPLSIVNKDEMTIVDFGGIIHAVVKDADPTMKNFEKIKSLVEELYDPPALGVMFYNTKDCFLTPIVYVKDVDTTYFEGSCGSGSTSVAISFAVQDELDQGTYKFQFNQPAGIITSTIERENGLIKAVYIEGMVEYSDIMTVEL